MNDKTIANWLRLSEYDLLTADAMLQTGRYLYVAFMCQQSVEKMLKAIYVKKMDEAPPRIHNLIRLSSLCEIEKSLPEDLDSFLIELNSYYLESRYNEDIEEMSEKIDKNQAEYIYYKTKLLLKWLTENT
jgi:HEPN domain-containing protein